MDDPLKPLLDEVAAQLADYSHDLVEQRNAEYKAIARRPWAGGCLGRASKRLETLEHFSMERAYKHVEIYKSVAEKYKLTEMLSPERMEHLRKSVRAGIHNACLALKDINEADCQTTGGWSRIAMQVSIQRLEQLESRVFDAANVKVRVIESSELAKRAAENLTPVFNEPSPSLTHRAPLASGQHMNTIAQEIDRLRLDCEWTAEELAERVGLTPRSVYRHLSGEDTPRDLTLAKYQKAFREKLGTSVNVTKRQNKS